MARAPTSPDAAPDEPPTAGPNEPPTGSNMREVPTAAPDEPPTAGPDEPPTGVDPAREAGGRGWDHVLVTLVVPCYNELATVERVLTRVRQLPFDLEVIVVDDGSTDGTADLLEQLPELIDKLVLLPVNGGKGTALRAGFERATGDLVAIQDADLEYDPLELTSLITPILEGHADAVYGSRFAGREHNAFYFWNAVGNRVITLLSNAVTNLRLTDIETCYKVVRRDLLHTLPLTARRFAIEPEITARLAQAGARVYELPISYRGRSYAEGKKIGWRDGVSALWAIFKYNFLRPKADTWERPASDPWRET